MKKWLALGGSALIIIGGFFLFGHWFWRLPFIPDAWRANFHLNANILPASDDSRAQYLAINPGFRAEFGDKNNPTSSFLRFEKTASVASTDENRDVDPNLLDSLSVLQANQDYQPGIEWQLFSVGIDESQLDQGTIIGSDEEILRITRELLGEQLVASDETDLEQAQVQHEQIQTETVVTRKQGYDQVSNRAVADDVDITYTVIPGSGIQQEIVIGDRDYFDTACLQLLSLTGSDVSCNLPSNKFSFLLQLDDGLKLEHTPLAIDDSQQGTYYLTDRDGNYLMRLGNPVLTDQAGHSSPAINFEIRPGEVGGVAIDNYYIVTLTPNLGWLIDSERQFPVSGKSGFYTDGAEFFPTAPTE